MPFFGGILSGIGKITDFAGKFIEDKTVKMKLVADNAKLLLEMEQKMSELAIKKASEGDMAVYADLASSRALAAKELEKAPWVIRMLNGMVRPIGGLGSLVTLFWMVWAQYFGYEKLDLPEIDPLHPVMVLLGSIIGFFFVLRHRTQINGVKDK